MNIFKKLIENYREKKRKERLYNERIERIAQKRAEVQKEIDKTIEIIRQRELKIKRDNSGLKGYFASHIAEENIRLEHLYKKLSSIKN